MTQALTCTHNCSHPSGLRNSLQIHGFYYRKSDRKKIQRFFCKNCGKTFSRESFSECYKQKKRHLNSRIFELLVSGVSQRRSARILQINLKTVVRKFILMGQKAQRIGPLAYSQPKTLVQVLEFDDLETFEHSKCKPLSVTLAVESKSRRILGFRVAQMPAKGLLAGISRKRYGHRVDHRKHARNDLFAEIKCRLHPEVIIKSDQNPHYGPDVKKHFPQSEHLVFKGRRGCVVGQGELKRGGYDPLFSLNHTFAMLRANINRLFRGTWCTTKKAERLGYHIALYTLYHNEILLKK